MTAQEAQDQARKIFPYPVELEKHNGTCRVLMPIEKSNQPEFKDGYLDKDGTTRVPYPRAKDGRIILGGGPSWLQAMRYAAGPEIKKLQAKEQTRKAKQQQNQIELQQEIEQFVDFLREKFSSDYEAWRDARKPAAVASPPVDANGSPVPA